ncbi:restriction alleviation protein, Lar family [Salmonella enterica]|nr:restriction alleviation protein, Lar family [Salmonella enterica]
MSEIKPCPFCGCKADWVNQQFKEFNFGGHQIACINQACQASGRYSGQQEKALKAWNQRVNHEENIPASQRSNQK